MEFTFATNRIKEICEEAALDLERMLADLEACDDAREFFALCGSDLEGVTADRWLLRLSGGCRIEVVAGHVKPRLTETGEMDWGRVRRLRIEEVSCGNE